MKPAVLERFREESLPASTFENEQMVELVPYFRSESRASGSPPSRVLTEE